MPIPTFPSALTMNGEVSPVTSLTLNESPVPSFVTTKAVPVPAPREIAAKLPVKVEVV